MTAFQRLKDALRLILADSEGDGPQRWHGTTAAYPHNWEELEYVEYFYRRDTILVRTGDVDLVLYALRNAPPGDESGPIIPEEVGIDLLPVIDGVTGLVWRYGRTLASAKSGRARYGGKEVGRGYGERPDDDDPLSAPNVLRRLDERVGIGTATPNHALPLCGNGHPCPATEPAEVPSKSVSPMPPVSSGICCGKHGWDGDGVLVGVVDEGLIEAAPLMWPWMAGVHGDAENPYDATTGEIRPYACHGTFVAGCVRCTAPKAEVCVKRAEPIYLHEDAGMAYEDEIIRRMSDLLDLGADVIVCEFDGSTRLHLPMLTFDAFYDKRLRNLNVVVVAPAGNDDTRLPTFPAAYSWVIGVGALSADANRRAYFSNYGGWVDVYAPGVDLVNAFAVGDYTCIEEPHEHRHFEGIANWSGTSFSTPLVAGMIAARMSATGENAPQAAQALLRLARSQALPGVGPVLLPHQVCGTPREPCHAGCDCACGCAVLS
ncbi:subtilase family protein [Kribbella antiqua]|uniref:Subtilase family protein n=1 Tax=Kribbella antiqua TaxID=2512217 RepID=A0A4R2IWS7_9ACTN|nr:S8/S53 family peptidase [Kribbella antiqua]TCO50243.1 subtilase family protein [Kribbella antiqua]